MRSSSSAAAFAAIMLCAVPGVAMAGPCSDDIASIGKQLSNSPALGPVTTGTLSGSNAGSSQGSNAASTPERSGTSASNRVGGTAGTKEMSAASGNVATSDADVRQQQAGHMTTTAQSETSKGVETVPGQQNANGVRDDHMSRAKVAWQKAVDLNARNDGGCRSAVAEARSELKGS